MELVMELEAILKEKTHPHLSLGVESSMMMRLRIRRNSRFILSAMLTWKQVGGKI